MEGQDAARNWRDVGATIANLRSQRPPPPAGAQPVNLPLGRLYRCGSVDFVSWQALGRPGTIVNLRIGADDQRSPVLKLPHQDALRWEHFPVEDDKNIDKYDTSHPNVRRWIGDVVRIFARPERPNPYYQSGSSSTTASSSSGTSSTSTSKASASSSEGLQYPVLLHCLWGRDRTGVVIAVLLRILGIEEDLVIEDFMISEGAKREDIVKALAPFRDNQAVETYFKRLKIDVRKVRANLLGST